MHTYGMTNTLPPASIHPPILEAPVFSAEALVCSPKS